MVRMVFLFCYFALTLFHTVTAAPSGATCSYRMPVPTTYSWQDPTGDTPLPDAVTTPAHNGYYTITPPFAVTVGCTTHSNFQINTNGFLTFSNSQPGGSSSNKPSLDSAAPMVAVYWDNWRSVSDQTRLLWGTRGQAPNRSVVVTWFGVKPHPGQGNVSFQVLLPELEGGIVFNYQTVHAAGSPTIGISTIGTAGGTETIYSYNQDSATLANMSALHFLDFSTPAPDVSEACLYSNPVNYTYTWVDTSADTVVPNATSVPGDNEYYPLAMPYNVTIGCSQYSWLYVNSNGFFTTEANLLAADSNVNDATLRTAAPMVAPLWSDWVPNATGSITWGQRGSFPARQVIITWNAVLLVGSSDAATFQVVLNEVDGSVVMNYKTVTAGMAMSVSGGRTSTIGVASDAGSTVYSVNMDVVTDGSSLKFSVVNATLAPTPTPTATPTTLPTLSPTMTPTISPTSSPTISPTSSPTSSPTEAPTLSPTHAPTNTPTLVPTAAPTSGGTHAPTVTPTTSPTPAPTPSPATPNAITNMSVGITESSAPRAVIRWVPPEDTGSVGGVTTPVLWYDVHVSLWAAMNSSRRLRCLPQLPVTASQTVSLVFDSAVPANSTEWNNGSVVVLPGTARRSDSLPFLRTSYFVRVRVHNVVGKSSWSALSSYFHPAPPDPPILLGLSFDTSTAVTLTFAPGADDGGGAVFRYDVLVASAAALPALASSFSFPSYSLSSRIELTSVPVSAVSGALNHSSASALLPAFVLGGGGHNISVVLRAVALGGNSSGSNAMDLDACKGHTCFNSTCSSVPYSPFQAYTCVCPTPRWVGAFCQYKIGPTCSVSSCAHGTCVEPYLPTGVLTCDCSTTAVATTGGEPGWEGAVCDVDVNECAAAHRGYCDPLTACVNEQGSYHCTPCPTGYHTSYPYGGTRPHTCVKVEASCNGGVVSELGGSVVCSFTLSRAPISSLQLTVVSYDKTEGRTRTALQTGFLRASSSQDNVVLTFAPGATTLAQSMYVQGVRDDDADGDQLFCVGYSATGSPEYAGLGTACFSLLLNLHVTFPVLSSFSPSVIPLVGRNLTISGSHLVSGLVMTVEGRPCTTLEHTSAKQLKVMAANASDASWSSTYRAVHIVLPGGGYVDCPPDCDLDGRLFYVDACPTEGQYGAGLDCVDCPEGAVCPGGYRIRPKPGWWISNEAAPLQTLTRCRPPAEVRCQGGSSQGPKCGEGYGGPFCDECSLDHYPLDGVCLPCQTEETARELVTVIIIVSGLFAIVGLHVVFSGPARLNTLADTLVTLQQSLSVVRSLIAFLPPEYQSISLYARALMLDYEFIKPQCAVGKVSLSALYFGYILFGTVVLLYVLFCAAVHQFIRRNSGEERWLRQSQHPRLVRAGLVTYHILYLQFFIKTVQVLNCTYIHDLDGKKSLRLAVELSTVCYEGLHLGAALLAWVLVLLYFMATPVFILTSLRRAQERIDERKEGAPLDKLIAKTQPVMNNTPSPATAPTKRTGTIAIYAVEPKPELRGGSAGDPGSEVEMSNMVDLPWTVSNVDRDEYNTETLRQNTNSSSRPPSPFHSAGGKEDLSSSGGLMLGRRGSLPVVLRISSDEARKAAAIKVQPPRANQRQRDQLAALGQRQDQRIYSLAVGGYSNRRSVTSQGHVSTASDQYKRQQSLASDDGDHAVEVQRKQTLQAQYGRTQSLAFGDEDDTPTTSRNRRRSIAFDDSGSAGGGQSKTPTYVYQLPAFESNWGFFYRSLRAKRYYYRIGMYFISACLTLPAVIFGDTLSVQLPLFFVLYFLNVTVTAYWRPMSKLAANLTVNMQKTVVLCAIPGLCYVSGLTLLAYCTFGIVVVVVASLVFQYRYLKRQQDTKLTCVARKRESLRRLGPHQTTESEVVHSSEVRVNSTDNSKGNVGAAPPMPEQDLQTLVATNGDTSNMSSGTRQKAGDVESQEAAKGLYSMARTGMKRFKHDAREEAAAAETTSRAAGVAETVSPVATAAVQAHHTDTGAESESMTGSDSDSDTSSSSSYSSADSHAVGGLVVYDIE